jgi:hypothetical protein
MRGSQQGSNVEAGTRRSELSILRGPLVKITIFLYNIVKPFCTYNCCIVYVRTVKKGNEKPDSAGIFPYCYMLLSCNFPDLQFFPA